MITRDFLCVCELYMEGNYYRQYFLSPKDAAEETYANRKGKICIRKSPPEGYVKYTHSLQLKPNLLTVTHTNEHFQFTSQFEFIFFLIICITVSF